MNNLSSYCRLVDAKIRASDKDLPVVVVVAEDSTDVVVSPFLDVATLFNWSTPAWVNCASCCDVRIKGFDGGGGSEKLNLQHVKQKGIIRKGKYCKVASSSMSWLAAHFRNTYEGKI